MAPGEHILIVGAGVFGASTAYHLTHPLSRSLAQPRSHSNTRITLLDRSPLGQGIGASEDINKIIRADYLQKFYMELGHEAIDAWKLLSRPGGIFEGLYHQTGWVVLDDEQSDDCARIRKLYEERGRDPTKTVGLDEIKQSYNGILMDADMTGFHSAYVNHEAGWANAGTAVKRMIEESMKVGLEYKVGDAVDVVVGGQNGVSGVRLASGELIEADKIVLATGAWTSFLMRGVEEQLDLRGEELMESQLTAAGVCVAQYQLTEEEARLFAKMPVIVNREKCIDVSRFGFSFFDTDSSTGEVLPPPQSGILKFTFSGSVTNTISVNLGRRISVPPFQDQSIVPQALKTEVLETIQSLMPHFQKNGRQVDRWRLCWDSITPTQNQLICQHRNPLMRNLYLAVGGSFHTYKFLPNIGKYVANVIRGVSNGDEKDRAWAWKASGIQDRLKCAHANVIPKRDLRDLIEL